MGEYLPVTACRDPRRRPRLGGWLDRSGRGAVAKTWRVAGCLLGLAAVLQTYAMVGEVFFGLDWLKGSPDASDLVRKVESSMASSMFYSLWTYISGFAALIAAWIGHWATETPPSKI